MKSLCGEELGSETGRDGGGRRPEIPAAAALCGAAWRREERPLSSANLRLIPAATAATHAPAVVTKELYNRLGLPFIYLNQQSQNLEAYSEQNLKRKNYMFTKLLRFHFYG